MKITCYSQINVDQILIADFANDCLKLLTISQYPAAF